MALSKEWYDAEFVDSESESLHRAPSIEYSFYNAVKTGDMEYVIKNCKEDAFIHLEGTGVLSRNTLQNIKYHFVVTTAMITRYCIDGGLEPERAYRLSDFYILKMDSCSTVRQVADLHHEMAKDFTGKMVLQKKSSILSKPVTQCVDYIYSNIKERITIADLAAYTGLSESYLSRVFKQNLGVSISDYIREKKIEKATHLLKYSDKPIIDIANYLSFSSQSHFIQIFEGFTGLTPKKYRDRYYKSMWQPDATCLVLRTKNSHTNMRGNFYLADTQYTISNAINFINYHSMYISTV